MTAASGPRQVTRIIKEKAAEMEVEQRSFTDEEILRRLLFASVNEACKILDDGKAHRASDIDVMWLNGFGFPRYRDGLMYWADGIGVGEVYRQIQVLTPAIWRALGPVLLAAPPRRNRHSVARGQTRTADVTATWGGANTSGPNRTGGTRRRFLPCAAMPGCVNILFFATTR
jgi:hypothetical protein